MSQKEALPEVALAGAVMDSSQQFFAELREELDDYRSAINQNQEELGTCFEYVKQLERKVEKLADRMEEVAILLGSSQVRAKAQIAPLNEKEKWIFMALYSLVHERGTVTYKQLAQRLNVTDTLVAAYLASMTRKGVPITKKYVGGVALLTIDPQFLEHQAKTNVLQVATPLSYWLH